MQQRTISQSLWTTAFDELMKSNPMIAEDLRYWLNGMELVQADSLDDFTLIKLSAPGDTNLVSYINRAYRPQIENTLSSLVGKPCRVMIEANPNKAHESSSTQNGNDFLAPPSVLSRGSVEIHTPESFISKPSFSTVSPQRDNIDPALTFAKYIVGPSNQFAYASAYSSADRPGAQFNPLFLYGPPAVGKTHLLHAIANHIRSKSPHARICMSSAENFVNEFIHHVQHKSVDQFRSKFRNQVDLLLLDDVQFILGKDRSEEEFFHTFNTLHEERKMIVLTSDKAPKEIDGLEERFRTRFEMGLVVDIKPPEIETRIAILKAKAEADDLYLPDDVANFLGKYVKDTVRNLHGVLVKLQQLSSLTGAEISLDLAKQVLQTQVPEEGEEYTIDMIINSVCRHYDIKTKDLKGTSKAKNFSVPRQISMYLIRKYAELGHREIGQIFGKDHSTVVHACKKIELALESDPNLKRAVETICSQF